MNNQIEMSVRALIALGALLASGAVAGFAAIVLYRLYAAGGISPETGKMLAGTMVAGSFVAILSAMFLMFSAPQKPTTRRRKVHG